MRLTDYETGKVFLEELLAPGIPVYVDKIFREAAARGISRRILKELRQDMNIQSAPVLINGETIGQVWFFAPEQDIP